MIKNERQYRIPKAEVQRFKESLAQLDQLDAEKKENPILWQMQRDAINSQLTDLREELKDYETLIHSSPSQPLVMTFQSLSDLPTALIKARIAAKLSQKALADRLGLKEQQIQRYEATEYASANLSRLIEISEILGLKLELKGDLTVGAESV